MAIFDLVKWNGSANLLASKFPSASPEERSTWAQLDVRWGTPDANQEVEAEKQKILAS